MEKELPCNQWIIDKYLNDPEFTLYYCNAHGPFAIKIEIESSKCPICKNACFTYAQRTNILKNLI